VSAVTAETLGRASSVAWGKIDGSTRYTQDHTPAGMVHGVVVRSTRPSARITGIDVAAATGVDGVLTVLTAADVPDGVYGAYRQDEPVLARDVVRYVGEPVALVCAETRSAARAAARLVEVGYEDLPSVMTLAGAVEQGAHQVHDGVDNAFEVNRIERGDVAGAFERAAHVERTVIESHRAHQASIEPQVSQARFDGDTLVVTSSTQAPFQVRSGLAALLGMPLSRVVVDVPAVGGGFGGKLHLNLAGMAALLARATGRPVQVRSERDEEMQAPAPRENSVVELESALDERGNILARRARIYLDAGAYAYDIPPVTALASLQAAGPYRAEAAEVVSSPVYTNTVPTGSFRAPSGPQMVFAVESHMEQIAERLGLDPVAYRLDQLHRSGDVGITGQEFDNPAASALLTHVNSRLDEWRARAPEPRPGRRRGYGLACTLWSTSAVGGAATVTLNEDGTVELRTGATEIGTGAVSTALATIVAEVLDIDPARVTVLSGTTEHGVYDFGSLGSRTQYAVGTAAARAAEELRDNLIRTFAAAREVSPEDVEWRGGRVWLSTDPDDATNLSDLAVQALFGGGPLVASARFHPEPVKFDTEAVRQGQGFLNEPTYHCHGVEIEVEEATGRIEVLNYVAAHDVGHVVNPLGARGQVMGGVVQGLGYALSEEIVSDETGRTLNTTLHDYRVPTVKDIPRELEVHLLEDHVGTTGYRGVKGIGEAPIIPVAAAVASALKNATGRVSPTTSMTPECVLRLLQENGTEGDQR